MGSTSQQKNFYKSADVYFFCLFLSPGGFLAGYFMHINFFFYFPTFFCKYEQSAKFNFFSKSYMTRNKVLYKYFL